MKSKSPGRKTSWMRVISARIPSVVFLDNAAIALRKANSSTSIQQICRFGDEKNFAAWQWNPEPRSRINALEPAIFEAFDKKAKSSALCSMLPEYAEDMSDMGPSSLELARKLVDDWKNTFNFWWNCSYCLRTNARVCHAKMKTM